MAKSTPFNWSVFWKGLVLFVLLFIPKGMVAWVKEEKTLKLTPF